MIKFIKSLFRFPLSIIVFVCILLMVCIGIIGALFEMLKLKYNVKQIKDMVKLILRSLKPGE